MNIQDNKALQRYIVINLIVTAIIGFSAWYILDLLDLRDFDTLAILFISLLIISSVISFISFFILKKKGVEVYTAKNMLIIGMPALNILIPIWIDPKVSLKAKVLIISGSVTFAIANFYAVHYGGKRLRKQIGLETEEDRREAEREEKAKKEKAAKGKSE